MLWNLIEFTNILCGYVEHEQDESNFHLAYIDCACDVSNNNGISL